MTTVLAGPEVPPVDFGDDIRYRSCRKVIRRAIAEWLRAEGLATSGQTWDSAWISGVRDIHELAALTRADGLAPTRLEGSFSAAVVAPGDFLPELGGHVLDAMRDPETGAYWLTVSVTRGQAVADEYDDARTAVVDVAVSADARLMVTRKPRKVR